METSTGSGVSLDTVLCTDELSQRPSRPPSYEAENRALTLLAEALADSPQTILQELVDLALDVLDAGSAGVSLLRDEDGEPFFYWPAIAGAWASNVGGGMPRHHSPCGVVVDRASPQLFIRPQRHYEMLSSVASPICEALLAPFHVAGAPVGTVWVIAHNEQRKFDAEDRRLITSLAKFTSAAYQLLHAADADKAEHLRAEANERRAITEAIAAAEANAKFRTFFEQGSYFAGVMTLDGTIVEANRLCLDACGFTHEQVIGKKFWEAGWWNRSADLMEMVREGTRLAASGTTFKRETPYFLADGSERIVELILAPVKDESGKVLFIAPTGTDITERKQAEQNLREADRRKDEFLAILAHELRNPLAPLLNGLQLMTLARNDQDAVDEARNMMERQLAQMVRLIDDLLDISRISCGKVELRKENAELSKIVQQAVETSRPLIEANGHTLTIHLSPEPLFVDADMARIAQVISNLLNNAAKYTEPGGQIVVAIRRDGRNAAIRVKDTGIGMPAHMLARVFEMFTQIDRSLEKAQGGLGVGLSLARGLVEMHGGSIEASSEGVGKGSEFIVRLSLVASQSARHGDMRSDFGNATARRILVVDDNKDSALSLAMMLKLIGNETMTAHDGLEALDLAAKHQPHVVFLDIGMPKLNGYEAARRIRQEPWGRSMVIVALTGWGQEDDRKRSNDAGFDHHLVKPVAFAALKKLLAELSGAPK